MEIFFLIMIFIMGTVIGSFLTLAVYRIPLNKNIVYERSFCPNCNHRLEFIDLIPVLSYLSLKGKCRYCGEKVRIRYLLLEVLSGLVLTLIFASLKISIFDIDFNKIIYFISFVMAFITICLISGIDKEHKTIDKRVLLFGLITQSIYEIYKCFSEKGVSAGFIVCLLLFFDFFIIDTFFLKKGESHYWNQIIIYITYLLMIVPLKVWWIFEVESIVLILCGHFYNKIKFNMLDKPDILEEIPSSKLHIGFFVGIASIVTCIINNFIYL